MNTQLKHAAAGTLAGLMLLTFMPFAGDTADAATKKMVVLGDSIASGKNLTDPAKSFVALAGSHYDVEIVNLAKDACTTGDLLATLDDPAVQAQLANADVIVFTAGVQDVMNPFVEEAEAFKQLTGANFETLDQMFSMHASSLTYVPSDDELQAEVAKLANALKACKDTAPANVGKIGEKLGAYSNAKVYCTNVYNPLSLIRNFSELKGMKKTGYTRLKNAARTATRDNLNTAYAQLAANGITVIDTYTKFDELAYQYTMLDSMRFEPNEEGHAWIGEQLTAALQGVLPAAAATSATTTTTKATTTATTATTAATTVTTAPVKQILLGDADGNRVINANDATVVLLAAARVGTGKDSGLSADAFAAADVNRDKAINAKDATMILRYAAAIGTGKTPKMSDFE